MRSTAWEDENFWDDGKRKCDLRIPSDRLKCQTASQCSERLTAPCQQNNQFCLGECVPKIPSTCKSYHDAICPPGFRCAVPLYGDKAGSCIGNGKEASYPEKKEPSTMIPPPSTWTGVPGSSPTPTNVPASGPGNPSGGTGGKVQPCGSRGHQPCHSGYRCAMYAINQFVADAGGECVKVGENPGFAEMQRPGGALAVAQGAKENNED